MVIPIRRRTPSSDARYILLETDDGSITLEESDSGNTFHSGCGAVAECLHVYARNSGVEAGLQQGKPQKVLELGFGTGLAFLVTASLAHSSKTPLQYTSFERSPLDTNVIASVLNGARGIQPVDDDLIHPLVEQLTFLKQKISIEPRQSNDCPKTTDFHCVIGTHAELNLKVADVNHWSTGSQEHFDAIYFDPFDPATNPELWSSRLLSIMHQVLRPGGRLVSYCVKSDVRRTLEKLGFHVDRVPGPVGGKREVLIATRPSNHA